MTFSGTWEARFFQFRCKIENLVFAGCEKKLRSAFQGSIRQRCNTVDKRGNLDSTHYFFACTSFCTNVVKLHILSTESRKELYDKRKERIDLGAHASAWRVKSARSYCEYYRYDQMKYRFYFYSDERKIPL